MSTISRFSDVAQLYYQTQSAGLRNSAPDNRPSANIDNSKQSTGSDTVSISQQALSLFQAEESTTLDAGGSQLPPIKPSSDPTDGQNTPSDAGGSQLPPLKPRDKN